MGWKSGLLTLGIDIIKCIAAVILMRYIYRESEIVILLGLYTSAGVILGHDFPFYLKFKGGKGIAATAGMILSFGDWKLIVIGILCFFVPVLITHFVSLGSLLLSASFLIGMIVFGQMGFYPMPAGNLIEMYVLAAALTALAYWQHRSNIKRLTAGKENKLF